MPGRREPTESAAENIPPGSSANPVRVKWCGKSAPRNWQQVWQGKPHPEQDQIEEHGRGPRRSWVDCLSVQVTERLDEWLFSTEPGLQANSFSSPILFAFAKHSMTLKTDEFYRKADQLIAAGRFIDSKGWVPATSGNFSARLSDGNIAITVSGRHKGRLQADDIMLIDSKGHALDGKKPSAETLLHTSLYQRFPQVQSVLHPHSSNATLAARLFKHEIVLKDYELLKALAGIDTHETRIAIPIFGNDQDIPRLAAKVDNYLDRNGHIHGYIIAGHGLYTWGASVDEALRHLEALEFLFDVEIRLHGVTRL